MESNKVRELVKEEKELLKIESLENKQHKVYYFAWSPFP